MRLTKKTLRNLIKEEVAAAEEKPSAQTKMQLDKAKVDAIDKAVKDIAKKIPKKKGESDKSWGGRIQDAAKKGLLQGIKATLLGPLSLVVSDEFALGFGKALAMGGGFVLAGPEGAAIGSKAMDIVSTLNDVANDQLGETKVLTRHSLRKMIREVIEKDEAVSEVEASRKMQKLERGPKAVKKLAKFDDVVYDGTSSLVDVLDIDDEADEK